MATATKKADNAAKTTKSNNKKEIKGTSQTKKTSSAKDNNAKVLIKPEGSIGDGMLDHDTKQKTAKAIEIKEPKKAVKKSAKTIAAKDYQGLDTQTLAEFIGRCIRRGALTTRKFN